MNIELESDVYVISEVVKKTRAKVFRDFEVGDELIFRVLLENTSHYRGNYATNVLTFNITQRKQVIKSQSELLGILRRNFSLKRSRGGGD